LVDFFSFFLPSPKSVELRFCPDQQFEPTMESRLFLFLLSSPPPIPLVLHATECDSPFPLPSPPLSLLQASSRRSRFNFDSFSFSLSFLFSLSLPREITLRAGVPPPPPFFFGVLVCGLRSLVHTGHRWAIFFLFSSFLRRMCSGGQTVGVTRVVPFSFFLLPFGSRKNKGREEKRNNGRSSPLFLFFNFLLFSPPSATR